LLLKTYQNVKGIPSYGQRFNGTYDAYNHPDLYPDQFHRFIQSEVIGKQRAFVLDYDPGVAVWNVPAFKILSRVIKEPTNINQVNVTTWVTYADMKVDDTDFVGTMETTLIYKYKLYGTPRADGTFAVSWGEWVEESRWDHPDFVLAIDPARIQRSVVNPEISSQTVDEILNGSR
jgi:hypothetical protein